MTGKTKNQWAFWLGVACAVPFAYASSYAVNSAPRAEGCSGDSGQADTGVLYLSGPDVTHVGADAFYAFEARTRDVDPEDALAAITLTVTDEASQPVSGDLVLLQQFDENDSTVFLLGWTAHGAARVAGETLSLEAHATGTAGSAGLEAKLTVDELEPELELPRFDIFEFNARRRDRGKTTSCDGTDECGPTWYATELREEMELMLIAGGVDPGVLVAWEFQFEPIGGKGDFAEPARPFPVSMPDLHEWVVFSNRLDEYCVRLVGRDLKTGVSKSAEVCATSEGELRALVNDRVGECLEPPAGLEQRWCTAIGFGGDSVDDGDGISPEQRETCTRLLGASGAGAEAGNSAMAGGGQENPERGGAAGAGGAASEVEPDAGPPPASDAGATNAPEDAAQPSRRVTDRGCACRAAADPTGHDATLAFTGLLAMTAGLAFRRRRMMTSRRRSRAEPGLFFGFGARRRRIS